MSLRAFALASTRPSECVPIVAQATALLRKSPRSRSTSVGPVVMPSFTGRVSSSFVHPAHRIVSHALALSHARSLHPDRVRASIVCLPGSVSGKSCLFSRVLPRSSRSWCYQTALQLPAVALSRFPSLPLLLVGPCPLVSCASPLYHCGQPTRSRPRPSCKSRIPFAPLLTLLAHHLCTVAFSLTLWFLCRPGKLSSISHSSRSCCLPPLCPASVPLPFIV